MNCWDEGCTASDLHSVGIACPSNFGRFPDTVLLEHSSEADAGFDPVDMVFCGSQC